MTIDIKRLKKSKFETLELVIDDDIEEEDADDEDEEGKDDEKKEEAIIKQDDKEKPSELNLGKTTDEVFKRIKNHPKWNTSEIVIGYMDRFKGLKEIEFEEFRKTDAIAHGGIFIPFHRVKYFKLIKKNKKEGEKDVVLWERGGSGSKKSK